MVTPKKLLLVNIAGLAHDAISRDTPSLNRLASDGTLTPIQPPTPALTSTSQATLSTGKLPCEHGIVSNGWYFRELSEILNWQRSANLVQAEPIWGANGGALRCANLFWRYATHASCDAKVTERPTYWVDGRKSADIYTEPADWRDQLVDRHGDFPLFKFWGPLAGLDSTRWITDATISTVESGRFDLVMTYLPHLDYDHQRFGPASAEGRRALQELDNEVGRLCEAARLANTEVAVVSDYAFEPVHTPVFLNRVLREAGYVVVQRAQNGELLEPGASKAFAICDQQTAHVYVRQPGDVSSVKNLLEAVPGVGRVFDADGMRDLGLSHHRSGELFVVAAEDHWFAYPYWTDESAAPDFAPCVAIHAKPGFDPTELFARPGFSGKLHLAKRLLQKTLGFRVPFDVIHPDASVVRGSHGRIPTSNVTRPVLLTSWQRPPMELLPMQDIRPLLLSQLAAD